MRASLQKSNGNPPTNFVNVLRLMMSPLSQTRNLEIRLKHQLLKHLHN